jgi:hypothetical protein
MATAEITPVVSAEMLESGATLADSQKKEETFVISSAVEHKREQVSAISVEFTQSPPSVTVRTLAEVPSARPQSVLFGALVHPKLRLRKPIPLELSVEEGNVVLSWIAADEFACGATMGEALDEFSKTVSELYVELNDNNVRLGADLERVRRILDEYIEPRHK